MESKYSLYKAVQGGYDNYNKFQWKYVLIICHKLKNCAILCNDILYTGNIHDFGKEGPSILPKCVIKT